MTKLFVHAKLLIDGISATPKLDQLISIEDDKIKAIEDYHEIQENVIEVNTITPGFFNCHVHILYPVGFDSKKEFSLIEKIFYAQKSTVKIILNPSNIYSCCRHGRKL